MLPLVPLLTTVTPASPYLPGRSVRISIPGSARRAVGIPNRFCLEVNPCASPQAGGALEAAAEPAHSHNGARAAATAARVPAPPAPDPGKVVRTPGVLVDVWPCDFVEIFDDYVDRALVDRWSLGAAQGSPTTARHWLSELCLAVIGAGPAATVSLQHCNSAEVSMRWVL